MRRSASDMKDKPSLQDAEVRRVIRSAIVAAILSDPTGAEALLNLSDAELGRLLKTRLMEVIGVAAALDLDLSLIREEDAKPSSRTRRRALEFEGLADCSAANLERNSLVLQGKLLPA